MQTQLTYSKCRAFFSMLQCTTYLLQTKSRAKKLINNNNRGRSDIPLTAIVIGRAQLQLRYPEFQSKVEG